MNHDALRRQRLAEVTTDQHSTALQFGCYIDGHWGQYAPDRLADLCESLGFNFQDNDLRKFRDEAEEDSRLWDEYHDATDQLTDLLNDSTVGGYWEWSDGELFLEAACCDCRTPIREEDMTCYECHPPAWICTDCTMWHTNADDTFQSDDCRQRAQSGPHFTVSSNEDTFSWSQCDSCGSTLGGSRHAAWTVES